jgi:hypothetical protein
MPAAPALRASTATAATGNGNGNWGNGNGNGMLNCSNIDADLTVRIRAPKCPARLPAVGLASLLYSYGPSEGWPRSLS